MNLFEELNWRGLVNQTTNRDEVERIVLTKGSSFYAGFDPTASSLHVGHLLLIALMKRLEIAGLKPIILVGGATGLIGDPSGKTSERQLQEKEAVQKQSAAIQKQLGQFFNLDSGNISLVNNYDWFSQMNTIEFLRDVGKYFTVGEMTAKDLVKRRIESGISFTEFSYQLLQSYDFLSLFKKYNCVLQVAGSDQWGNITAGVEFIRKTGNGHAHGLTIPLVTKNDGTKFGKTESGALWLDAQLTTPYQFYQFWLNVSDADATKFLKLYTFLSPEEIEQIESETKINPEKRIAQQKLAEELTAFVHSASALRRAQKISRVLFSGAINELSKAELEEGLKDVPSSSLSKVELMPIVDFLVRSKISPSKRQAREDTQSGAISINGKRWSIDKTVDPSERLFNIYIVVRRGKKNYHVVRWVE
ncbi:MAG: tyrosine--tRNA ligase [Parcubacteria group bacterium]|nr:tyrosine--tRNA ligase [Parcubacteria group bacterium]